MNRVFSLMTGVDIPCEILKVNIHQPTMKEISYIGEDDFLVAVLFLCINKEMFMDALEGIPVSNFDILISSIESAPKEYNLKDAITKVLRVLFLNHDKIAITPQSILLISSVDGIENIVIDKNNFEEIQEIFKEIFCLNSSLIGLGVAFKPKGAKAREIAAKLMKGRERAAKDKKSVGSVFTLFISALTIGVSGNSLHDYLNMTMFLIFDLMQRYGLYMSWDLDIRARLAGSDNKDKPEDWMKSLYG